MSEYHKQTSAVDQTYFQGLRRFSGYNTTNEDIPPFAIMQLKKPEGFKAALADRKQPQKFAAEDPEDEFFCHHARGGDVIWDLGICDSAGAARQNAAQFVFNGPTSIPRHDYGPFTVVLPCQVLHDGRNDSLPNWAKCGPAAGKWWVLSTGSAFTTICHDVHSPPGKGGVHTIWIGPGRGGGQGGNRARFDIGSATLAAGAYLPLPTSSIQKADRVEIDNDGFTIRATEAGDYSFSFQATVRSLTADRGEPLLLRLYTLGSSTGDTPAATFWCGERLQDIELDGYGTPVLWTAENVAFSGDQELTAGAGLRIRNDSAASVILSRCSMAIRRSGLLAEGGSETGLVYP